MTGWNGLGTGSKAAAVSAGGAVLALAGYLLWGGAPAPRAVLQVPAQQGESAAPTFAAKPGPVAKATTSASVPPPAPAQPKPQQAEPALSAQSQSAAPATVPQAGAATQPAPKARSAQPGPAQTASVQPRPQPQPSGSQATRPAPPSFDVVRYDADGQVLIAGRAQPGATIGVLVEDASASRTRADDGGRFVVLFSLPPSDRPRGVTLAMTLADGRVIRSAGSVILAPTPAPQAVASVKPEVPAMPAAPAPAPATATQAPAAPETTAPAVLLADKQGVRVLQPAAPAPEVMSQVVIDSISYGQAGQVELAGRGNARDYVRLYVDNRPILTTRIAVDGNWKVTLPDIDEGVHRLRADQVSPGGKVTGRSETPFKREAPATLAAAGVVKPASGAATAQDAVVHATIITVQPGYTLWGIARRSYGHGILYVKVFQANRGKIRDPDLIYPGQIFSVPGAK